MRGAVLVALLLGTSAARADCDHFKWGLAQEKAWFAASPAPLAAGAEAAVGARAYEVALKPEEAAEFVEPPRKKTPGAYGGMARTPALAKGLYQITLSREAWVDVIQNGAPRAHPQRLAPTRLRDLRQERAVRPGGGAGGAGVQRRRGAVAGVRGRAGLLIVVVHERRRGADTGAAAREREEGGRVVGAARPNQGIAAAGPDKDEAGTRPRYRRLARTATRWSMPPACSRNPASSQVSCAGPAARNARAQASAARRAARKRRRVHRR